MGIYINKENRDALNPLHVEVGPYALTVMSLLHCLVSLGHRMYSFETLLFTGFLPFFSK